MPCHIKDEQSIEYYSSFEDQLTRWSEVFRSSRVCPSVYTVLPCMDTGKMTIWEINSHDRLKFLKVLVSVYGDMEDLMYSDSESCIVLYGHL